MWSCIANPRFLERASVLTYNSNGNCWMWMTMPCLPFWYHTKSKWIRLNMPTAFCLCCAIQDGQPLSRTHTLNITIFLFVPIPHAAVARSQTSMRLHKAVTRSPLPTAHPTRKLRGLWKMRTRKLVNIQHWWGRDVEINTWQRKTCVVKRERSQQQV
jgi:hypothetical protein